MVATMRALIGFNPRAPCGARRYSRICFICSSGFNPRAPCGARPVSSSMMLPDRCFNPRAPCGARRQVTFDTVSDLRFQSTRPMRGATRRRVKALLYRIVSIHAPHAGRDRILCPCHKGFRVSIHAPHAGRDLVYVLEALAHLDVSIHAPHAGRDPMAMISCALRSSFNPRAPCGARLARVGVMMGSMPFQSTRPMRGATAALTFEGYHAAFQSTRPMRGATSGGELGGVPRTVSIHAPHAGRDVSRSRPSAPHRGFNPRAPCGARLFPPRFALLFCRFNPRAPCGARQR